MTSGYLLDTDHVSFIQREDSPERPFVMARIDANLGICFFGIPSFHEQCQGVLNELNPAKTAKQLLRGYRMQSKMLASYQKLKVLPFDDLAAEVWEKLRDLNLRIGRMDLRIAAIARSMNLTVVTRNKSDFGKLPGLPIADWSK